MCLFRKSYVLDAKFSKFKYGDIFINLLFFSKSKRIPKYRAYWTKRNRKTFCLKNLITKDWLNSVRNNLVIGSDGGQILLAALIIEISIPECLFPSVITLFTCCTLPEYADINNACIRSSRHKWHFRPFIPILQL